MTDESDGIEVSAPARRQLHRLSPRVAAAVVEFITAVLPTNPMRLSKPLTGELDGLRSARRGDYRVLMWIDEARQTVVIVRVAHRSDVYREPVPGPREPRP